MTRQVNGADGALIHQENDLAPRTEREWASCRPTPHAPECHIGREHRPA